MTNPRPANQQTHVILVDRIDSTPADSGHGRLYVVSGRTTATRPAAVQYSTHNEEKIALCRWAEKQQLPIRVTSRKRGCGHELLAVAHVGDK